MDRGASEDVYNTLLGTVEKAQIEAEGTLSFRPERRQERVPDGSLYDANTFSTVPNAGIQVEFPLPGEFPNAFHL